MTRLFPPASKRRRTVAALALPLILTLGATSASALPPQEDAAKGAPAAAKKNEGNHGKPPTLGVRVKDTIKVKGRTFKDLNANGKLDPYEDWRLPAGERAANLVSLMTLEEKSGLMLIDTLNAACDPDTKKRGTLDPAATGYINDQKMHRFIFRNTVTSADKAVCGGTGEASRPARP